MTFWVLKFIVTIVVWLLATCAVSLFFYIKLYDETRQDLEDEPPTILIKYLRDIKEVYPSDKGDWIDLRCGEDIVLDKDEYACLPLGVAMQLPQGYSALIVPRSSTFFKWHIIQVNSVGVIDNSYCGEHDEWMMPVMATQHTHIYRNDRICQFRLIKNEEVPDFIRCKTLHNPDRGGFGSTGEN